MFIIILLNDWLLAWDFLPAFNTFFYDLLSCSIYAWPHLDGEEYYTLIDEFMAAIKLRWPRALIQFEDFQSKHAIATLKRYRKEYLMFNDDIQVNTIRYHIVDCA